MARPRIRTLKPEMWEDEKVGRLSRDARLLFVTLITLADDDGRFRALPAAILGHGFPYDYDAPVELEGWMRELIGAGLVVLWWADGVLYGAIPGWSKHQKINRATSSSLPKPPRDTITEASLNGHGLLTEGSVNAS